MNEAQSRELAMSAMIYVIERPQLAGAFLAGSGMQPEDLRQALQTPELAFHALDFLLEEDSRVLDAAEALAVRPRDLLAARTAVAGPGNHGWEAD